MSAEVIKGGEGSILSPSQRIIHDFIVDPETLSGLIRKDVEVLTRAYEAIAALRSVDKGTFVKDILRGLSVVSKMTEETDTARPERTGALKLLEKTSFHNVDPRIVRRLYIEAVSGLDEHTPVANMTDLLQAGHILVPHMPQSGRTKHAVTTAWMDQAEKYDNETLRRHITLGAFRMHQAFRLNGNRADEVLITTRATIIKVAGSDLDARALQSELVAEGVTLTPFELKRQLSTLKTQKINVPLKI